jgi:hypothetical protein
LAAHMEEMYGTPVEKHCSIYLNVSVSTEHHQMGRLLSFYCRFFCYIKCRWR